MPKRSLDDLQLLGGGPPLFEEPLHVGRPNLPDREALLDRIGGVLDRGWLTNNGPLVQELERNLAEYLGVRHCIPICNGTIALELTVRALDLVGEVIVPSFTFVATAHSLFWQQITPVFCDIDPATHNIDPGRVEELVTPKTTGIIGVHVWGRPCAVDALSEIAERRGLKLMFDAAHAFGCSHRGRAIGSNGNAEVFSFHATKFFNTFEGGAIATDDDGLAEKIRLMKNFGFAGYDNVIYIGTNGKMNEISAAMGLTSLESMDEVVAANVERHDVYREGLAGLPGVRLVEYDTSERSNFQYVVAEVDESSSGLSRDEVLRVLVAENVLARRYFYPGCHRMEPYRSHFPHAGLLLPQTEALAQRVLVLPTGPSLTPEMVRDICGCIRLVVENGREVSRRLWVAKP